MSGALDLDLCIPHKAQGRLVRAIHTVNGEGMCGQCFRGAAIDKTAGAPVQALGRQPEGYDLMITDSGIQAVKKGEGKPMPGKKNVDWNAVQRDRDAGMKITEMEKKYGVANPTIYHHTHGNGKRSASRAKARTNERTNERKLPSKRGGFDEALARLRQQRADIDEAIQALEKIS